MRRDKGNKVKSILTRFLQALYLMMNLFYPIVELCQHLGTPIYFHTGTPVFAMPFQLADPARKKLGKIAELLNLNEQ